MKKFDLTNRALDDLHQIWNFVSESSFDAADRMLEEFYRAFSQLAEMPGTVISAKISPREMFSSGAFNHT